MNTTTVTFTIKTDRPLTAGDVNKWVHHNLDTLRLPDGSDVTWEITMAEGELVDDFEFCVRCGDTRRGDGVQYRFPISDDLPVGWWHNHCWNNRSRR